MKSLNAPSKKRSKTGNRTKSATKPERLESNSLALDRDILAREELVRFSNKTVEAIEKLNERINKLENVCNILVKGMMKVGQS